MKNTPKRRQVNYHKKEGKKLKKKTATHKKLHLYPLPPLCTFVDANIVPQDPSSEIEINDETFFWFFDTFYNLTIH